MRPLVHIGYHKTATTWLQKRIFTNAMGFAPVLGHDAINSLLIAPHDLDFDPIYAASHIDQAVEGANAQVPVLSSENLSGHPFYGGRASAELAYRLKAVLPDAHILMTVRSQTTMLPSVYMQYLKRGGTLSPPRFFEGSNGIAYPGFEPQHFEYDRLISLYQTLFEDVHVITHEALCAAPEATIRGLRKKFDMPDVSIGKDLCKTVSPSPGQQAAGFMRKANRLRRSMLNPSPLIAWPGESDMPFRIAAKLGRCLPKRKPVEQHVARFIAPRFHDSNVRLSELTGGTLDLTSYP